jgi:hypothetical protein
MRFFSASRTSILVAALCLCAPGQDTSVKTEPLNEAKGVPARPSPGDYQGQAKAGAITIAADFDEHAVPTEDGTFSTDDYVVVEAAFFGPSDARLKISPGDFSLRINERKTPLSYQAFEFVGRTLKDPNWVPPDEDKDKGKSKGGLSTGGDGQAAGSPPPAPPKMPVKLQLAMEQHVHKATFLEGDRALPQAGLLFFEYRGKPKNMHSVELIYNGPAGKATLTLQP